MEFKQGTLVVSLDFELYWGVRDSKEIDDYRDNLAGVWKAIPALLELFERYGVHATWASVGLLFAKDKAEALKYSPARKPSYDEEELSPYKYLEKKDEGFEERVHHAPSLVGLINSCHGQEVATHTYSHYYCQEKGQSIDEFEDDIKSAIRIAENRDITISSLVFPRNQCNEKYLDVLLDLGIRAYRGNEKSWIYSASISSDRKSRSRRAARLIDTYVNFSGHHTYDPRDLMRTGPPFDIPSSRFLRPISKKLRALEPLRLRRIKRSMRHAALHGEVFHLWFHPHNFGVDLEKNMKFLEQVLKHYSYLSQRYNMASRNMGELAARFLSETERYEKTET